MGNKYFSRHFLGANNWFPKESQIPITMLIIGFLAACWILANARLASVDPAVLCAERLK